MLCFARKQSVNEKARVFSMDPTFASEIRSSSALVDFAKNTLQIIITKAHDVVHLI